MTDGEHALSPGARSEKRALRAASRRRRLGLSSEEVAARSARIVDRLLPLCQRRQRVALFSPMELRREVDLRMLDATLRASGVALYYPWQEAMGDGVQDGVKPPKGTGQTAEPLDETEPSTLQRPRPTTGALAGTPAGGRIDTECFRGVTNITTLERHPLGFLQPADDAPIADALDVIVVPALALTAKGDRLGYGAGYYDRALQRHPEALGIAVCYSFELVPDLPVEPHDQRVAMVVTDEGVFYPR